MGTRARVKTPFSVALGMQYSSKNDKNTVSITAEYFNGIDSYAIIDPQVDVYSLPSEWEGIIDIDDAMSYYTQANPVVNLGVGFNRFISPTLSLLGGFRTDFASQNNNDYRFTDGKFKVNQLHVNKYYFTIGPMARIKNFYFVSGLQYSFGRNYDVTQIKNYSHPVEYNPESKQSLEGARENTAYIRFRELSFFLGLTIDFK